MKLTGTGFSVAFIRWCVKIDYHMGGTLVYYEGG